MVSKGYCIFMCGMKSRLMASHMRLYEPAIIDEDATTAATSAMMTATGLNIGGSISKKGFIPSRCR